MKVRKSVGLQLRQRLGYQGVQARDDGAGLPFVDWGAASGLLDLCLQATLSPACVHL